MSDFLNNLGKIGMVLQAGGGSLAGRDGMAVVRDWEKQQEDARKREAISGLLAQSGIGGIQRGLLEQLPVDQQAPAILNMLAQMEAQRQAGGAAAAAEARAAREAAERESFFRNIMGDGQPAPTAGGFSLGERATGVMPPSQRLSFGTPAAPVPQYGAVRMPSDASGLEARALRNGDPASVIELPPRAPLMQPQEVPPTRLSFGEPVVAPATSAASGANPAYDRAVAQMERLQRIDPLTLDPVRLKYWEDAYNILDKQIKANAPPEVEGMDTDLANTYRDDLRSEPEVANFRLVRQGFDTIEALYQNPGAVSDYALAVGFAKIVDPGSVAREGEVAAVQGSTALSDRLKQQVINALNGTGALPEESRKEIADLGLRFYNRAADRASTVLGSYRNRTERAQIPFDEIWAGGDIEVLPDDYLSTLTVNPNAQVRFNPPPPPAPGPVQGPPAPPPPLPAPPPVPRTMGDAMVPTQEQLVAAISTLSEGQRRVLARIKGAENQVEYLRRLGALK